MKLRRVALRRKTDLKTGKHTLCEPAQLKCTWTGHKNTRGILWGNLGENAVHVSRGKHFVRACAVEMHMDTSQEAFCVVEIYRENAGRFRYHLN